MLLFGIGATNDRLRHRGLADLFGEDCHDE